MPKPVYLLTVQEAHKEYNSLTDQIQAKYNQLDSGEYGAVGISAVNAKACELAKSTCSCEPTLPETEPANSKGIIQAHILQILETLFGSKLQAGSLVRVRRMQLCSQRYLRITGLLSTPSVLRIGVWLCILPAITLVV